MKNIFIILLLCVWGLQTQAQNNALSLEAALQKAFQQRSTVSNANLEGAISQETARATKGQYLPQVTANAEMRLNAIRQTNIIPGEVSGRPGTTTPIQFGTVWQNTAGVTVTQKLYDGANLSQQLADAIQTKIANNSVEKNKQSVAYEVIKAYYQALWYAARVQNLQVDYQRKLSIEALITSKEENGRALSTEVTEAKIGTANAKVALNNALRNVILAKQYLLYQIGSDTSGGGGLQLSNSLAEMGQSTQSKQLASGSNERPEVTEQALNEDLAIATAKVERKRKGATLSMVGYLGAQGFDDNWGKSLDLTNNWYGNSYIGLQAAMPLFNGFDSDIKIKKQLLKQQQISNTRKELTQSYAYEAALAQSAMAQTYENWQVKKSNAQLAKQSAELVKIRRDDGRATIRETLDANALVTETESQETEALYNYLLAALDLAKANGSLGK